MSAWTSQSPAKARLQASSPIKISMVQSCHHTKTEDVSLHGILIAIRKGKWEKKIETIRSFVFVGDAEEAEKLKNALPAVMFRGRFSKRANGALLEYSGIIDADLDDVQDIEGTREKLMQLPQVLAIFRSPSGRGLKVLVKGCRDPARHPGNFRAVQNLIFDATGIEIDRTPDVARLCYVSYDSGLYLNENATELDPLPEPEKPKQPINHNGEVSADLPLRERIATEKLGALEWCAEKGGYLCECPGVPKHTTPNARKHTIVYLRSRSPSIKCQHTSCDKIVEAFNTQLRSLIGNAEREAKQNAEPSVDVDEPKIELPPPAPAPYIMPPLDLLPQVLRDYVQASAACLDVSESYVFQPLLPCTAAHVGNSRSILLKRGYVEPPIIWTGVIGPSGSLKSPAIAMGCLASMEVERELRRQNKEANERYEDEIADWKNSNKKLRGLEPEKPGLRRHVTDDLTIEVLADLLTTNPRGLLIRKDELSQWFASFDQYRSGKGSDVGRWLSLHTGVFFAVDRRSDDRHYTIFDPRVSINGGIQPKTLRRVLTEDFFERGLPARFLLDYPPPDRPHRWTEATVPEKLITEVLQLFDQLWLLAPQQDNGHAIPELLTLTPEAKEIFVAFYNATFRTARGSDEREEAAWAKLPGQAARLALIGQLAHDPQALVVSGEVMQAACKLAEWYGHEAARIYGELSETEPMRERRELIEFIRRRGGSVTVRDIMQGCRRLKNDRDGAERELHALVKGRLRQNPREHASEGRLEDSDFPATTSVYVYTRFAIHE